jgi:hypothetical protein
VTMPQIGLQPESKDKGGREEGGGGRKQTRAEI